MDYEQFKKGLVRIACLVAAEQHIGGIDKKLENETAIKQKQKKKGVSST